MEAGAHKWTQMVPFGGVRVLGKVMNSHVLELLASERDPFWVPILDPRISVLFKKFEEPVKGK